MEPDPRDDQERLEGDDEDDYCRFQHLKEGFYKPGVVNKVYFCTLCKTWLNSTDQKQAHVQGKKHREKVDERQRFKNTIGQSTSQKRLDEDDYCRFAFKKESNTTPGVVNDVYRCTLCSVWLYSIGVKQEHIQGKKHLEKVEEAQRLKNTIGQSTSGQSTSGTMPPKQRPVEKLSAKMERIRDPVVGLEYIEEFLPLTTNQMEPFYKCTICRTKGDGNTMLNHVIGYHHQATFFFFKTAKHYSKDECGRMAEFYCEKDTRIRVRTFVGDDTYPWPRGTRPSDNGQETCFQRPGQRERSVARSETNYQRQREPSASRSERPREVETDFQRSRESSVARSEMNYQRPRERAFSVARSEMDFQQSRARENSVERSEMNYQRPRERAFSVARSEMDYQRSRERENSVARSEMNYQNHQRPRERATSVVRSETVYQRSRERENSVARSEMNYQGSRERENSVARSDRSFQRSLEREPSAASSEMNYQRTRGEETHYQRQKEEETRYQRQRGETPYQRPQERSSTPWRGGATRSTKRVWSSYLANKHYIDHGPNGPAGYQ